MSIVAEKITNKLERKNLTRYEAGKLLKVNLQSFYHMVNNERPFTEKVIKKILPILEVSREEFESWIVADKYSKEVLQIAIETKKNSRMGCQPIKKILTMKLDEILQSKNLSRTALSKLTGNSQSGLNRAITGKEALSKKLMQKISTALEIPENEIQSWVIADKYPLKVLELAVNIK